MVHKPAVPMLCLALATFGLVSVPAPAQNAASSTTSPAKKPAPEVDLTTLHVQVILDKLGYAPGVLDGKGGQSLKLALRGFQAARGLKATGEADRPTLAALARYKAVRPVTTLRISAEDAQGPFFGRLPKDPAQQAKMPSLGYANLLEKLAEKFHTTPATIVALNAPGTKLGAGAVLRLPNALPDSRDYPASLPEAWRKTLSDLNVSARQPQGDRIVVDKSEGALKVFSGERMVAQFPATMGSGHDPLPIGKWKINGASYNPEFHYNPDLFWDVSDSKKDQLLPPGPNGPVGVIWLDLSKEHYGIHGTPAPETIGRAESHGCIRLTNWDAARLSLMVKPGTPAVFQN